MKTNAYLNTFLFKSVGLSTNSITSGIMVCHPLEAGTYRGSIVKQEKEIGTFTIVCNEAATETQAHIDLYKIDHNLQKETDYKLHPGGFAIFFASFGEGGYQVVLLSGDKVNVTEYTTTKLQKGDLVVAMLLRPGQFEMTGSNQQKGIVLVERLQNKDEYEKIRARPVDIKLNEKEFSNKEVKLTQGQGLVVGFETEGELDIKLTHPTDINKIDKQKRHNWENVKYKFPTKKVQ